MHAEPNARDHACSENTVATLMKAHRIRAKAPRRFARTTDSRHGLPVVGNVLGQDFDPTGPNEAWCADITYVGTREGWLYLAVVEDLFSRMVVGWAMADAMASRLVVDALSMAIAPRRPGAGLAAHPLGVGRPRVRATVAAAGARKSGPRRGRAAEGPGRRRAGFGGQIHAAVTPLTPELTGSRASDGPRLPEPVAAVETQGAEPRVPPPKDGKSPPATGTCARSAKQGGPSRVK